MKLTLIRGLAKWPINSQSPHLNQGPAYEFSVSSRISIGQGYQGFLRKRAGSSFGQKRAICVVQGKTLKMDRI
jgi:hypothetical protein